MWPGAAKKVSKAPKSFAFKGTVTHHDIFVVLPKIVQRANGAEQKTKKFKWVEKSNLRKEIPSSLIRKVLDYT